MTVMRALILTLLANLSLLSCTSNDSTAVNEELDRPNVVYILSDSHRWGAMSFTQTPGVETPNLDTLAQQGISFNRAYAADRYAWATYRESCRVRRIPTRATESAGPMPATPRFSSTNTGCMKAVRQRLSLPTGRKGYGTRTD